MNLNRTDAAAPGGLQLVPLPDIGLSHSESQGARRKQFVQEGLQALTESIAAHGVLQPIIIRPRNDVRGPRYELVAGERRVMAATKAGLVEIPAVVRTLSDEEVIEVQLIENLQREDLHPMHEAEGYQELMTKHGHVPEELAGRVGKSRSYVYARLKLLELTKPLRTAFYEGRFSPSIALLLARIPGQKLQREALHDVAGDPDRAVSFRRAQEIIRDRYTLQLKTATFPIEDPKLNGAGPCGACPKRTGNQAELFGDIGSPDVCTDPACFQAKTRAHGQRLMAAAKKEGRPVVTGEAAKKAMPYSYGDHLRGYVKLDEKNYGDPSPRTRTNRQILGPDVEVTLLQNPRTGAILEVVPEAVVDRALKTARGGASQQDDGTAARRKKAQTEAKFRKALYAELRPLLEPPTRREMARAIYDRLEFDSIKLLAAVREWQPPEKARWPGGPKEKDYRAIGELVETLPDDDLSLFVNDMIFARELMVSTWSDSKPEKLLAAAKAVGIDTKKIRAAVKPKPKAKKKAAAKGGAKRRAGRKAARAAQVVA